MVTDAEFEELLPLACEWAEAQERIILNDGLCLSDAEIAGAFMLGVNQPDRVRVLAVTQIPVPDHPKLRALAKATELLVPETQGLTLRYGIYLRVDCHDDQRLLLHELVHTSQYERLGGFEPFLRKYLHECFSVGYAAAPMEQEARLTAARFPLAKV